MLPPTPGGADSCSAPNGVAPSARLILNVLISNVDDHLRNHGLLWTGSKKCSLSPTYDLNPTAQLMHQ
jgi:hypothetical protein